MISDIFKAKLEILANDDLLLSAIKSVFIEEFEKLIPKVVDETDKLLGSQYRAYMKSKEVADNAFKTLNTYKVGGSATKKFNKSI